MKTRGERLVRNKAVYVAIGIACHDAKEALGLWIEQTKGAKFWMSGMTEIKGCCVVDILIAVVDGL